MSVSAADTNIVQIEKKPRKTHLLTSHHRLTLQSQHLSLYEWVCVRASYGVSQWTPEAPSLWGSLWWQGVPSITGASMTPGISSLWAGAPSPSTASSRQATVVSVTSRWQHNAAHTVGFKADDVCNQYFL